uniref:(northern house mosquito) hypothetical protein n=1 Tax=Culex pipiens TaxID=7175 RepID=A0A8D8B438_CULPI
MNPLAPYNLSAGTVLMEPLSRSRTSTAVAEMTFKTRARYGIASSSTPTITSLGMGGAVSGFNTGRIVCSSSVYTLILSLGHTITVDASRTDVIRTMLLSCGMCGQ